MKAPLLFALASATAISFVSCKKCYDCHTVQTITYDDEDTNDMFGVNQDYTVEKCDRKKNIEDYEKEHTASASSTDFWGSYTSSAKTTCTQQ